MRLSCSSCKAERAPEDFFDGALSYTPALDVVLVRCAGCAAEDTVQVETGAVWFGYVAGAGTAHFTGMQKIPVPELLAFSDEDGVQIVLGRRTWNVPAR